MKRKLVLLFLVFAIMMLAAAGTASAAPVVYIDGDKITFEVPPVVENGRSLVPLRAIFEELGADVDWNRDTKTVTAYKDGSTIVLTINSTKAYINGSLVKLEVPAKIKDGKTLVPLRFVSEAMKAYVGWDGASEVIQILTEAPFLYLVTDVIDGDTIQLDTNDAISFLGLKVDNAYENKAAGYVKNLLAGKKVWLEYDELDTDDSGRIVAYVYMEDGTFLNARVLAEGYAREASALPNVKYQNALQTAQQKAKSVKKGLWAGTVK